MKKIVVSLLLALLVVPCYADEGTKGELEPIYLETSFGEVFKDSSGEPVELPYTLDDMGEVVYAEIPVLSGVYTIEEVEIPNEEVLYDDDGELIEPELETELVLMQDGEEVYKFTDISFEYMVYSLLENFREDVKLGLDELTKVSVTRDHIKLDYWGDFFYNYYDKTLVSFPLGNIILEFDDYSVELILNENSKEFIVNRLIPEMSGVLEDVALEYPVYSYVLNTQEGASFVDFECDLTDVVKTGETYPFDGGSYLVYNTGAYYAVTLNVSYVEVLKGYIEGANTGYYRPVEGDYPGSVNVLSYITLLDNVEGYTLIDKGVEDFTLYNNMAVTLDTKELIDLSNTVTESKELRYSDYGLDIEELVLVPIDGTVVVVQSIYKSVSDYLDIESLLYQEVDVTPFLSGSDTVLVDGESVPLSYFVEYDKFKVRWSVGSFETYYTEYTPYESLVYWYYNDAGSFKDESWYITELEEDLNSQGRAGDFTSYLVAAGEVSSVVQAKRSLYTKIAVVVVLVGLIAVVIFKIRKKSKEVTEDEPLFEENSSFVPTLDFDFVDTSNSGASNDFNYDVTNNDLEF